MKRFVRIVLLLLFLSVLTGAAVLMLRYSARKQAAVLCGKTEIKIERHSLDIYLQNRDVEKWLADHGISIVGKRNGDVCASGIEQVLLQNPYIGGAQVFMTQDGNCHLYVDQRNPVLKVVPLSGPMFQIDREGVVMPVNTDYAVRLRVASGYIPVRPGYGLKVTDPTGGRNASVLEKLYEINAFLMAHPFWDAMFEQIYVTYSGEYELVPKVGGQLVRLGRIEDMADLADKMERLELFYQKSLSMGFLERYSVLDLKYRHQLVATRRVPKY